MKWSVDASCPHCGESRKSVPWKRTVECFKCGKDYVADDISLITKQHNLMTAILIFDTYVRKSEADGELPVKEWIDLANKIDESAKKWDDPLIILQNGLEICKNIRAAFGTPERCPGPLGQVAWMMFLSMADLSPDVVEFPIDDVDDFRDIFLNFRYAASAARDEILKRGEEEGFQP